MRMILFNLLNQFTDLYFDSLDQLRESEIQSAQAIYIYFLIRLNIDMNFKSW